MNTVSFLHTAALLALAGLSAVPTSAQTIYQWNGTVDSNWETVGNWQATPGKPTAGAINVGRLQVYNKALNPLYYTAAQGTTIFAPSAATTRALVIASGSGNTGAMFITGGLWESRGTDNDVLANGVVGSLTVNGGGYTNWSGRKLIINYGANSTGTLNVLSGFAAVDTIQFGNDGNATGTGIINLDGGTLWAKSITDIGGAALYSLLNLNGGALRAMATGTLIASAIDGISVKAGGARFDTGGFDATVAKGLTNGVAGTDGGLVKLGAGTLTLSASNNFNGGATLYAGTIAFATNALGAIGTITFAGSAGLKWGSGNTEDISPRLANLPAGVTVTFDDGGNNLAFGTALSGDGNVTKAGAGRLTFNLANSYTGLTTNTAGILRLANNGALGSTGNGTVVTGGRLELANGITVSGEALTISGDGGNYVGAIQAVTGGYATWAGPLTITGSNTRMGAQSNATLEISGPISGAVPLAIRSEFTAGVNDAGTVVFSGPNTYATDLVLASGTLRLAGGNDRLPANYRVLMGSNTLSATLDLNGTSPSIAGLSVSPGATGTQIIGNSSTTSDATLTLGAGFGPNTTNTYSGVLADAVAGGSHKLNLTIAGGQVTLTGSNTFSGATLVSAGRLVLSTNTGGGPITVNDTATFTLNSPAGGGPLVATSLLFNGPAAKTNEVNLGGAGLPVQPLMRVAHLELHGTVYVNFSGVGLALGRIPLVDFDTLSGNGNLVTNALPAGVVAHIETNLVDSSIDLVLDQVPSLLWLGQVSGVPDEAWDIGATANWWDKATQQPATFLNNLDVTFDDSATNNAGTTLVTLLTNVQPFLLLVSNNAVDYTFRSTNAAHLIGGNARLVKEGPATLTLAVTNNAYTGYTLVNGGVLKLGAAGALPGVPLTNNAIVDLNGFAAAPGGLSGNGVVINTTATSVTNRLSVGNGNSSGNFAGRIDDGVSGKVEVAKAGSGTQVLRNPANTYSGGTLLSAGTLQLGADHVLGAGPLTLNGGILSSDGTAPRALTNALTISANATLGHAASNGLLGLGGPLDFAGGNRNVTANSPVILGGNSLLSAGGLNYKEGPATLTLQSNLLNWIPAMEVHNGTLMVDGAWWTNAGSVRSVGTVANGSATLALTNGALIVLTNPISVVRAGSGGTGGSSTATNILDVAGSLLLPHPGSGTTDGKVLLGRNCARAILNLRAGGLLLARKIERDINESGLHEAEFNFDGGTLKPSTNDLVSAFFQGLTEAKVRAGGAVIDTAGYNVTLGQSLLEDPASPGGGLTKQGAGTLLVNGANSYAGTTVVSAGTLGGTGLISGPVSVPAGSVFAPGLSIGTLTINHSLTLAGTTRIEVNRTNAQTSDKVLGLTMLNRGGGLEVINLGPPLLPGDSFEVFSAVTHAGQFAPLTPSNPNSDPALVWDTTQLLVSSRLVVHRPPVAANDSAGAGLGQTMIFAAAKLLLNDSDSDGDPLTMVAASSPSTAGGTVALTPTNTLVYTAPLAGASDSFTYTLSDGRGGTATGTVNITLTSSESFNRVAIETLGNGDAKLTYRGIPHYPYALDWTHALVPPSTWVPLLTNQASDTGLLLFTNTPSGGTDFYRTRHAP